ncbi:hypothetical protein LCGC14_2215780, partial [marine sediment metagenome]
ANQIGFASAQRAQRQSKPPLPQSQLIFREILGCNAINHLFNLLFVFLKNQSPYL